MKVYSLDLCIRLYNGVLWGMVTVFACWVSLLRFFAVWFVGEGDRSSADLHEV